MKNEFKKRKNLRIPRYNYSNIGYYFITMCTQDRKCTLSNIINNDNNNFLKLELLPYGIITEKYLKSSNAAYNNLKIYDYIIMPNHVHFICEIKIKKEIDSLPANQIIPSVVGTLKKLINKECEEKIWQRNYYEHIIRDEKEYLEILQYIQDNPYKWIEDKYYL